MPDQPHRKFTPHAMLQLSIHHHLIFIKNQIFTFQNTLQPSNYFTSINPLTNLPNP